MGFEYTAKKYWPNVDWHGMSDIHVSICWGIDIPEPKAEWKTVLAILHKYSVAEKLWRMLQKKFDGFVWIIEKDEFVNLFMVDCYRHLHGLPDSKSVSKLLNPHTGNRFHRLALRDNLVGGIRFWCDPQGSPDNAGEGGTTLGWRFRIEAQKEEEDDTRRRTRETVAEAGEMAEEVYDSFMEITEIKETTATSQLIHAFEFLEE